MYRTSKLIPDILKLVKQGVVDKVIAERLRCSEAYIRVVRARNGIYYKPHQVKHKGRRLNG